MGRITVYSRDPHGSGEAYLQKVAPPGTNYYNLFGRLVLNVPDGENKKILVIHAGNKQRCAEAIAQGLLAPVPSNEVIETMERAFDMTEATGKEYYFRVGLKGTVSIIVEGSEDTVGSSQILKAAEDLVAKGDLVSYDVHTHPRGLPTDSNYGLASGSATDLANVVGSEPNIVLGYKQVQEYTSSNVIGPGPTYRMEKHIRYFNRGGDMYESFLFSEYCRSIRKINEQ
jgi:proteasome lid subunit RPN8/RPN11